MRRLIHRIAIACTITVPIASGAQVAGLKGTIIVTNKTPSTATIVDVGTGRILATLPTGAGPHEIAITSDGKTAVVTDYGGPGARNTLTVIDVVSRKIARTIDLGQYRAPHGIRVLPGDSLVAVTSEATQNLVIVNFVAGAVRRAIATHFGGSHMVGIPNDAKRAFTGNISGNSVSELDLVTGAFVRSIDVPAQPEGINVTPDGREVWVGSNATGRVSVIDVASGAVTPAAEGVSWPYRMLFTPDVKTVVIPDLRNHEVRFLERASRRELSRIKLDSAGPQGVTITPDGRYVLLSLSTQSKVAIIDMRTRQVVGHLAVGETPDGIVYTTRSE